MIHNNFIVQIIIMGNKEKSCVISGFRHDVGETCTVVEYYAALSGSSVPIFRDNVSVPSSRVKKSMRKLSSWTSWTLKMGPIVCPETLVQNYHWMLCNIPEDCRSQREILIRSFQAMQCHQLQKLLASAHVLEAVAYFWLNILEQMCISEFCWMSVLMTYTMH